MVDEEVNIGLILGPFGVKGELKVMPLLDDSNRLAEISEIRIGKEHEESKLYEITRIRIHKTLVIIKLKGISSREDSMGLKNSYIRLFRSELEDLGEDQFYLIDLEGMEVFLEKDNVRLGILEEVIKTGANDIFSIQGEDRKYLIPAIKDVIKNVDVENKKMYIESIEGLLELKG